MTVALHTKSDQEHLVTLTDKAQNHILRYLEQNGCAGIRLSVKKSGCSGLAYVVDYIEVVGEEDITQEMTDNTILAIDKKSYPFIKGMSIDYVQQGLNHKFVFINPNQTGQCGCGESFTIG